MLFNCWTSRTRWEQYEEKLMPTFGSSPEFFSLVYARHSGDLIFTILLFSKVKKVLTIWALKFLSWQTPKVADTGAITVVEQDAVVTSESRWVAPTRGPGRHSCYSEDDRCPGLCTSQDIAASRGEDLWPASPQATPPGTGSPTPTNTLGSAIQHNLETFACGWRSNNSFSFRQWRC